MPAEDLSALPVENDGSYDHAVAAMNFDLTADDPKDFDQATGRPIVQRDETGKFKGKEDPAPKVEEPEAKAVEPTKEAIPEDDEDDQVELPPEKEGEQPTRVKLNEVVDGWKKAKTLEAELETARAAAPAQPLPHEIEQHVAGLQKERSALVDQAQIWLQLNQPRQPSMELINPQSQNYNPEEFHRQVQVFQRQQADYRAVTASIEAANQKTKSEQEAIRASKIAREQAEIQKAWPEVYGEKNKAHREAVAQQLLTHYKVDDALLDQVLDHRFYLVAKDALAYRQMMATKGKEAEAVKAVKAKPKLIQGHARSSSSNPKAAKQSEAFSRLSQSGSVEDAADALEGFL